MKLATIATTIKRIPQLAFVGIGFIVSLAVTFAMVPPESAQSDVAAPAIAAAEFKNGTAFALGNVPKELVVERRAGEPVRFSLEENPTTGFTWEVESNTNECEIALERRGRGGKTTCGAPGNLDVTVTSRVYTPARVEFRYRRPWEKDVEPWKTLRLVVNTVDGEKQTPLTK